MKLLWSFATLLFPLFMNAQSISIGSNQPFYYSQATLGTQSLLLNVPDAEDSIYGSWIHTLKKKERKYKVTGLALLGTGSTVFAASSVFWVRSFIVKNPDSWEMGDELATQISGGVMMAGLAMVIPGAILTAKSKKLNRKIKQLKLQTSFRPDVLFIGNSNTGIGATLNVKF